MIEPRLQTLESLPSLARSLYFQVLAALPNPSNPKWPIVLRNDLRRDTWRTLCNWRSSESQTMKNGLKIAKKGQGQLLTAQELLKNWAATAVYTVRGPVGSCNFYKL